MRGATTSDDALTPASVLARVVAHYHRTFCTRRVAQAYLARRGLTDQTLLTTLQIGYADGSLRARLPRSGPVREALQALGVLTRNGRELLGGCIVVPIPDPVTGAWTTLYGRGVRTRRHCYLPGPLRGVLNSQAARSATEVILTESILDALSFLQAGISTAIPLYGANGFTADHWDMLTREHVQRVVLALDQDDAGRTATAALGERLMAAGLEVRVLAYPPGVKDANELLVSAKAEAPAVFATCLAEAQPVAPPRSTAVREAAPRVEPLPAARSEVGVLTLARDGRLYQARVASRLLGRLRTTVKGTRGDVFHVDTIDLYAARSRSEFARRAGKRLEVGAETIEADLLAVLAAVEPIAEAAVETAPTSTDPVMTEAEHAEALAFLRRPDLLDQVARDIDALGYVGETTNTRLLYLVAISRKLADPLSAIVLSQSGAGKSGLTEVIEQLTPPEDVVLLTRLTPQSLYYVEPRFLDRKLVIVEERYGSMEADYSIRVLQSRKKLIAAAPIKDPQTGNLKTRIFTVEARAAFIEATTASAVNHENATRCFELRMDESQAQTARIHARMSRLRTEAGLAVRRQADVIAHRHWHAQRLLLPAPVIIPYADVLTFPSAWLRTRRDYARFLNLIEVSAFLHQYQRERRGEAVVASVADYAVAYGLAAEVLADTLAELKRPLQAVLDAASELAASNGETVTRRALRQKLQAPDSSLRTWLTELVSLEYLEADCAGVGKTARYRVAARPSGEALVLGLLTPEDLARRWR